MKADLEDIENAIRKRAPVAPKQIGRRIPGDRTSPKRNHGALETTDEVIRLREQRRRR